MKSLEKALKRRHQSRCFATGNPYSVVGDGDKVRVITNKTGRVHGTFTSRKKAMKQFRLLEGIEHGMVLRGRK